MTLGLETSFLNDKKPLLIALATFNKLQLTVALKMLHYSMRKFDSKYSFLYRLVPARLMEEDELDYFYVVRMV